jgi:hypothetical protein
LPKIEEIESLRRHQKATHKKEKRSGYSNQYNPYGFYRSKEINRSAKKS